MHTTTPDHVFIFQLVSLQEVKGCFCLTGQEFVIAPFPSFPASADFVFFFQLPGSAEQGALREIFRSQSPCATGALCLQIQASVVTPSRKEVSLFQIVEQIAPPRPETFPIPSMFLGSREKSSLFEKESRCIQRKRSALGQVWI